MVPLASRRGCVRPRPVRHAERVECSPPRVGLRPAPARAPRCGPRRSVAHSPAQSGPAQRGERQLEDDRVADQVAQVDLRRRRSGRRPRRRGLCASTNRSATSTTLMPRTDVAHRRQTAAPGRDERPGRRPRRRGARERRGRPRRRRPATTSAAPGAAPRASRRRRRTARRSATRRVDGTTWRSEPRDGDDEVTARSRVLVEDGVLVEERARRSARRRRRAPRRPPRARSRVGAGRSAARGPSWTVRAEPVEHDLHLGELAGRRSPRPRGRSCAAALLGVGDDPLGVALRLARDLGPRDQCARPRRAPRPGARRPRGDRCSVSASRSAQHPAGALADLVGQVAQRLVEQAEHLVSRDQHRVRQRHRPWRWPRARRSSEQDRSRRRSALLAAVEARRARRRAPRGRRGRSRRGPPRTARRSRFSTGAGTKGLTSPP